MRSVMNAPPNQLKLLQRRYRPIVPIAGALCVGIAAERLAHLGLLNLQLPTTGLFAWWSAALVSLLLASYAVRSRRFQISLLLTLLAVACAGGCWHHLRWNFFQEHELGRYLTHESQPACLKVVLTGPVDHLPAPPRNPLRALPRGESSEAAAQVIGIRDGQTWRPASGQCLLRVAGHLPESLPGQQLQVFAKVARIKPSGNPGEFDWAKHNRGQQRLAEVYCRHIEGVTVSQSAASSSSLSRWPLARLLAQWQTSSKHALDRFVGTDRSPLAGALLLGKRKSLTGGTYDAFVKTGVVHLLVVSGLHIGMVAAIVFGILRLLQLPRAHCLWLAGVAIVAYALLAGLRPPVVRAVIMTLLALAALGIGRALSVANMLAAALVGVLIFNPSELFQAGTQLSFLTVTALFAYGRYIGSRWQYDPLRKLIHESQSVPHKSLRWFGTRAGHLFAAALIAWLAATPVTTMAFHRTTPASVIIAPLLWPLVGLTMFSGLGVLSLAWLPPLASLFGWICQHALTSINQIVRWASATPWSSFYRPGAPWWWVLGLYLSGLMYVRFALGRIDWRWGASLATLWVAVGLLAASSQRTWDDQLRCTFLSMGHGVCAVVELPGGQTLLYDAGSLTSPERATQTVANFLWSKDITSIDAVVLSHADVDHYNALPGLLERFPVGVVYVSPLMFDPLVNQGHLDAPEYVREILTQHDVPLREVWMNDQLKTSAPGTTLRVLHPPRQGVLGNDNANSILLEIEFAGRRLLLPGDLESPGIESVMADPGRDVDVLLAPHHGSQGSDPPGFARWCQPEWVVVSGRQPARTVLATQAYHQQGAKVLHTSEVGAVEVRIETPPASVDPPANLLGGLQVTTFRP